MTQNAQYRAYIVRRLKRIVDGQINISPTKTPPSVVHYLNDLIEEIENVEMPSRLHTQKDSTG